MRRGSGGDPDPPGVLGGKRPAAKNGPLFRGRGRRYWEGHTCAMPPRRHNITGGKGEAKRGKEASLPQYSLGAGEGGRAVTNTLQS